jgi:hypothetical protein
MVKQVSENGVVRDMTTEEEASFNAITTQAVIDNNANKYKLERSKSYPSVANQLDMLWHAIDGDETLKTQFNDFYTAIKTVKDNNPKS